MNVVDCRFAKYVFHAYAYNHSELLYRVIETPNARTMLASSGENICNGRCPSVCLSRRSIAAATCSCFAAACRRQSAAVSGQRQCCDPRTIDADLFRRHQCNGPVLQNCEAKWKCRKKLILHKSGSLRGVNYDIGLERPYPSPKRVFKTIFP